MVQPKHAKETGKETSFNTLIMEYFANANTLAQLCQ